MVYDIAISNYLRGVINQLIAVGHQLVFGGPVPVAGIWFNSYRSPLSQLLGVISGVAVVFNHLN